MAQTTKAVGGGPIEAAPGSTCMYVKSNRTMCNKSAVDGLCKYHKTIEDNREAKKRQQEENYLICLPFIESCAWENPDVDTSDVCFYLMCLEEHKIITECDRCRLYHAFTVALEKRLADTDYVSQPKKAVLPHRGDTWMVLKEFNELRNRATT